MSGLRLAYALPAALLVLSACDGQIRSEAREGLADGQRLTAAQRSRLEAAQRGEVIVETTPWYGTKVAVKRGSRQGRPLPKAAEGAKGLTLAIDGQVGIRTIAGAIEAASDIPVSIRTRYILDGGDVIEVPIGTRMRAAYTGPLSGFLDRLSARMDVAWSYDGKGIAIDRMITRDWRVPLPRARTTFTDEQRAGGISLSTAQETDPWAELGARLAPLAPAPARVGLFPDTGRVSVFGPPSVQARVGTVIEDVIATAAQRIGLEVGIYFVDSDKADAFGIALDNLGATIGRAAGQGVSLTARAAAQLSQGGGSLTLRRGERSLSFEALARSAAVVDYRRGSTTTQSGVVAPISLTRTESYNRQARTVTAENGTSTGGQETVEFETGILIASLPRLIDHDQLQLGLSITQRDLVRRDGNGFPVIDARAIRTDTVLAPGETLVVTGYEQTRAGQSAEGVGLLRAIGLGGRNRAERRRVRMYVLIRPTVLPGRTGGRSGS